MPKAKRVCKCGAKEYMDHIRKIQKGFYKHSYTGPYGPGTHRKEDK